MSLKDVTTIDFADVWPTIRAYKDVDLRLTGNDVPAALVHAAGIKYQRWEGQPIADQIMLYGIDVDSLPKPLPAWARLVEDR